MAAFETHPGSLGNTPKPHWTKHIFKWKMVVSLDRNI